jgi:hypothetical protein
MHFSNTQFKKTTKGGSVLLLNKIEKESLPVEGGAIISNRIVGITSNAVRQPPKSMAMASVVGGMLDFNKHVKTASRNIQKKKDKDENIKFVY